MKILIGSPIHQQSLILKEFLESLKDLEKDSIDIHYYFIDDNNDNDSKDLLNNFYKEQSQVNIIDSNIQDIYWKDDVTHIWTESLIDKVAKFKNMMIDFAKENSFDYLFLIDSDIVLHPKTLKQLVDNKKDIVSEIFWTRWQPNTMEMPQVWVKDSYTFYDAKENVKLDDNIIRMQTEGFLGKLRVPGVYRVGGLGACTLISKNAIDKGVNFNSIYNVSFWGEDRAFCIRAVAVGLELYVDTHYPAYHIYRLSDIEGVKPYKNNFDLETKKIQKIKVVNIINNTIEAIENYPSVNKGNWKEYFLSNELIRIEKELIEVRDRAKEGDTKKALLNRLVFVNESIERLTAEVTINNTCYNRNKSYNYSEDLVIEFDISNSSPKIISYKKKNVKATENYIVRIAKGIDNQLALSMVVKNEEGRYLEKALMKHREYIDKAIFIDDGSTDNTVNIIKDCLSGIDIKIIKNPISKFNNEIALRKQQWYESIKFGADWLLILDADEIFEDKFKDGVRGLINNRDIDAYSFRLYDFWSDTEYREDSLWKAHLFYKCFLVRPQINFNYQWIDVPQHCGRMPLNVYQLPNAISQYRLKHMGWSRQEDREAKYNRYLQLDANGEYGSMEQYKSILDKNPNLVLWKEE